MCSYRPFARHAARCHHNGVASSSSAPAHKPHHGAGAGLPPFLRAASRGAPVPVQRDGPVARLTGHAGAETPYRLHLDPDIEAWLLTHGVPDVQQRLAPGRVRAGLLHLNPAGSGATAAAATTPATAPASTAAPRPPTAAAAGTDSTAPAAAPTGSGGATPASHEPPLPTPPLLPEGPRRAGFGVWWALVMADPAISHAVDRLQSGALDAFGRLSTGEKVASGLFAAGMLATAIVPLSLDPRYRDPALRAGWNALNGSVLPIPWTPLSVELNLKGGNLLLGLHLDVGRLLPPSLGFRSASPVGASPLSEPPGALPLSRLPAGPRPDTARDDGDAAADDALPDRIRGAARGGRPLGAGLRNRLEHHLGADLSGVRVHADAGAAELARAVDARAFTTGHHVFLGPGAPSPGSVAGERLLAHEATHVAQQAAGPFDATVAGGLAVSHPDGPSERAARRVADRL